MARLDELRLMAKVARLYHGAGLRQTEITERLNIHQSTVSRLLRRAEKEGIVRVTLSMPSGLHPELEDALAVGLRAARGHRRRRDRSGRPDRARPGRGRGLLSGDDAEADGCRRHLVVECGAAGDGGVDAPESPRRRRAGGPDSRRHRQPGRGSPRDPADAPAGQHGRPARRRSCPHPAPSGRPTPGA